MATFDTNSLYGGNGQARISFDRIHHPPHILHTRAAVRFDHAPVAHSVVHDDDPARPRQAHGMAEIRRIAFLVDVNEGEVGWNGTPRGAPTLQLQR